MLSTTFIETFEHSEFAVGNIPVHLKPGFPILVRDGEGLAVELLYHCICLDKKKVIQIFAPVYKVVLRYPSGRILQYVPLSYADFSEKTVQIPLGNAEVLEYAFRSVFEEMEYVLEFFEEHHRLTDILLSGYNSCVKQYAEHLAMGSWYGGIP